MAPDESASNRRAILISWAVIVLGMGTILFALVNLSYRQLNVHFLLLALATILLSTRITVRIPFVNGQVTASDVFIFLTLLIYGGKAAVILAAIEGAYSSFPYARALRTLLLNSAVMAISTFLTAATLHYFFRGHTIRASGGLTMTDLAMIAVMALVQFLSNSGLTATITAIRSRQPIFQTWSNHFLWVSLTHFASASAAGLIAKLVILVGFPTAILAIPIVVVIFIAYRTYRQHLETSAEKATQAERHVEELNRYIAEQERIREQFSQIEKLSALGELASGVAHNFNNTLAGILGRAQLLLNVKGLPEEAVRGIQIIAKTAEDGARTVKRIQDFARQRRDQEFAPVSIDQLIWDVAEITRPRWKDRAEAASIDITLAVELDSKATIRGDAGELREVLVNMVFNAVDAMPAGGRLTLATRDVDNFVEVSISDTGQGMSEEVRSRIFDPFFTTKGKSGMGLGLAVSYGIISRHEGTIEVESKLGQGTTFRIRLARVTDVSTPAPGAEPATRRGIAEPLGKVKILIVEDEDYVRELLRDILEGIGCEIVLAENGTDALELIEAQPFDAVFTDVGLPGMSGWDLARQLRGRQGELLIAVITGWGDAVTHEERETSGVNWVVSKPFTVERIISLAEEVSRRLATTSGPVEPALVEQDSTTSDLIN